ncbi:hypothetical protein QE152_g6942 [Popillia japonica]|uniref:Uncharacterized protein n=1 Tax=Popillia japonica TaxID=7064 RepID=A0AAW1MCT5_POPJA
MVENKCGTHSFHVSSVCLYWRLSATVRNATNAFRDAEVWPIDTNVFKESDFAASRVLNGLQEIGAPRQPGSESSSDDNQSQRKSENEDVDYSSGEDEILVLGEQSTSSSEEQNISIAEVQDSENDVYQPGPSKRMRINNRKSLPSGIPWKFDKNFTPKDFGFDRSHSGITDNLKLQVDSPELVYFRHFLNKELVSPELVYFRHFLNKELVGVITEETNRYAETMKNKNMPSFSKWKPANISIAEVQDSENDVYQPGPSKRMRINNRKSLPSGIPWKFDKNFTPKDFGFDRSHSGITDNLKLQVDSPELVYFRHNLKLQVDSPELVYFRHFLNKELVGVITEETNRYAETMKNKNMPSFSKWVNVNISEMYTFTA